MEVVNPWAQLPRQPQYVLADDKDPILKFNAKANREHRIRLELIPEPFLGQKSAPIVLLNLNPGFDRDDVTHHNDPTFAALSRRNLTHDLTDYPFYLLHPSLKAPGTRWWQKCLSPLLDEVSREVVARSVLCVEFFPYHSMSYSDRIIVPSQAYSYYLVRTALRRGALIVLLRGVRRWETVIPELVGYPRRYQLQNPRQAVISPRNCPDGFRVILETLRAAETAG